MCCDGNSATQSVRYLNAQLASLYLNASECVASCPTGLNFKSKDYDRSKYARSLAQYHYLGPKPKVVASLDELFFVATFAQPQLSFVCNHEAILYLTIKEGHYNLDYKKAPTGGRAEGSKNRAIENLTLAFRVKFVRSGIKGNSQKIGNGSSHLIQLMILDLDHARLAHTRPALSHGDSDAIVFYVQSYLDFLEHAGHHVLFDLPDFDDDKYSPTIDYSVSTTLKEVEQLCGDELVHGRDLCEINDFLYKQWLSVARSIDSPKDMVSLCLAEMSSRWLHNAVTEHQFHIRFGAPKVRALCSREAIITFKVEKIAFFLGGEDSAPEQYSGWEISFVVDVDEEKECEGAVTNLKLDLSTARFSPHFSTCFEPDEQEAAINCFFQIVQFLSVDYLDILTQYSMHVIHHVDTRVAPINLGVIGRGSGALNDDDTSDTDSDRHSEDSNWEETAVQERKWRRRHGQVSLWTGCVEQTVLYGYDQVLAISEESINQLFWSLWQRASKTESGGILSKWVQDLFSATFESIQVRLLSNGKVIVWVRVNEGELRVRSSEDELGGWWLTRAIGWAPVKHTEKTEAHAFADLSLAFEVDLKFVDQGNMDLHESWHQKFKESDIFKCHQNTATRVFNHLVLDFSHATYRSDLSAVDSLCGNEGRLAVEKLNTAISYFHKYLGELAFHGHHIIHSVPLYQDDCSSNFQFGLSSVAHYISTKSNITAENCCHARKSVDAPVVLVLGMTGGRQLVFNPPKWGAGWVAGTKSSLGTVCLSREAFLEGVLLKSLAKVNAMTTIVPNFAGVIDGKWNFDLTTWSQHQFRQSRECSWTQEASHDGCLYFVWEHRDLWAHEHDATYGVQRNGEHSLDCRTKNRLQIPTTYRPGALEIILSGHSSLKVTSKDQYQRWSKTSAASWSVSIFIYSRANGLQIEVTNQSKPTFEEVESEGDCCLDVGKLHAEQLPQVIGVEEVIGDVRAALEGAWKYSTPGHCSYGLSNPCFNGKGDLVLQLAAYDLKSAIKKKEAAATPSTPSRKPYLPLKSLTASSFTNTGQLTNSTLNDSPPLRTPRTPLLDYVGNAATSILKKGSSKKSKKSGARGGAVAAAAAAAAAAATATESSTQVTTTTTSSVTSSTSEVAEKVEEHAHTEVAIVGQECHVEEVHI